MYQGREMEDLIMHISTIVIALSGLVALLAIIAAGFGLFGKEKGSPYATKSLRGQEVQIFGRGLYRYDTLFIGAGYRGQDAVMLFLGVPLLVAAILLSAGGSALGQLLLTGVLGYFLYVYASMALGAAYNRLFLVYVVLLSASLFAFVVSFAAVDLQALGSQLPQGALRTGLAVFMIVGGLVTLVVWGAPLVSALVSGDPPERLDTYTTMVTYALDLSVITPATFICAVLVLQDAPLGYLIAVPLLTIIILLAPQIILSTVFQRSAGVPFTTGEMIGPVAGFTLLGLVAIWLFIALLSNFSSFV